MATMIVIRQGKSPRSICRLCFMERENHQPIFESEGSSLDKWISSLISLKIVDAPNAPASICSECKTTLEDFESFIEMCRTNDSVFNEMFLGGDQEATEEPDPQNSPEGAKSKDFAPKIEYRALDPDLLQLGVEAAIIVDQTTVEDSTTNDAEPVQSKQQQDRDLNAGTASTGQKAERCSICKYYFHNISEHILTHNEKYECNLCPKTFIKKSLLRYHLYRHKRQRNFVCKECDKAFKYPSDLQNHLRIHTNEKPFKCKECDNTYRTQTNLTRHEKVHKNLAYLCEHCKSAFTTEEELKRHGPQLVRKPYECDECSEDFATCDHLVHHRKTEHQEETVLISD